ncbi:hypothetical protein GCM10008171_13710 [Methylopila jiangsuensis]|uniref:Apea-like HEPN domain-containing protein n=1 Tax=Methylopila jiangsuensis TaxID=586230 RepID=A0A9W6JFK0_9HYPH|nr:hypothetical protein [Methylopila jiangsuensis]MDR6286354.1 hypothetical protein [Methylopila jiangsuensis]GLK76117.1 hypothetical protein GCM10008171_13710 [Methylopila jiangsuensis]
MATLESHVEALITELTRVQASGSIPDPDEEGFSFPGQIAVGNDRFLMTTREMERLIELSSRELKRSDPVLSRTHTDKEWNWMVRSAFGPALMLIDLDDDRQENARTVIAAIRAAVSKPAKTYGSAEHVFGCTLFGNFEVALFSIGPVQFEPRLAWLSRKLSECDVTKTTAQRVTRVWSGNKLRKRKTSVDSLRERDILDAVGKCPYVCSVRTEGLASEAGRLKAQTAARLAMTGIALRWAVSSKALDGFRLLVDPSVRRQRSLVFKPKVKTLSGGNLMGLPHGPTISPENWAKELTKHRDDFDVVGEAIAYYLSPDGKVVRPTLMNTFAQALLWFHEGCRDEVDLMAVVKFSACLDALASGGKSTGIRSLIRARLGMQDDKPIRKDGPTMHDAVQEIYSSGRSRTIHGTNDKIGNDWSSTRVLAEQFARLCLVMCLDWGACNPTSNDPLALKK